MTFEEAEGGLDGTLKDPEFFNGSGGIFGTRGLEAATAREKRRNAPPIAGNQEESGFFRHHFFPLRGWLNDFFMSNATSS